MSSIIVHWRYSVWYRKEIEPLSFLCFQSPNPLPKWLKLPLPPYFSLLSISYYLINVIKLFFSCLMYMWDLILMHNSSNLGSAVPYLTPFLLWIWCYNCVSLLSNLYLMQKSPVSEVTLESLYVELLQNLTLSWPNDSVTKAPYARRSCFASF